MVWGGDPGLGLPPPTQSATACRAPNRARARQSMERAGWTCFRKASGLLTRCWIERLPRHRLDLWVWHLEPYLWSSDMNVFGTSVCHVYVHCCSLNSPQLKEDAEDQSRLDLRQPNRKPGSVFTCLFSFPLAAVAAASSRWPWGVNVCRGLD